MGYWRCPRCAEENSLDAIRCWSCGFQNYNVPSESTRPAEARGPLRDTLEKERQAVRDALAIGIERGRERVKKDTGRGRCPERAQTRRRPQGALPSSRYLAGKRARSRASTLLIFAAPAVDR